MNWNRLRLVIGCAAALLLPLVSLSTTCGSEAETRSQAIAYLQTLPPRSKIYVWPTRIRPYEVVGQDEGLEAVIGDYKRRHEGVFLMTSSFGTPMISIYKYDGSAMDHQADFFRKSKLPMAYKRGIGGRSVFDKACAYDAIRSRDTWAAGGFVFLDAARLLDEAAQAECVVAGLDFINGFPTVQFDYRAFPPPDVRQAIIEALAECSAEGRAGVVDEERTRDGLTPLPSIDCAVEKLKD